MTRHPEPLRIALVGLPGAGKTRLGQALARRLGWPFHDADSLIEGRAGATVAEIFRDRGERAFRDMETEILGSLAAEAPPLVVATGGGIVEREENRRVLGKGFFVVWIQVDFREAARRLEGKTGRPLLAGGDAPRVLQGLAARRSPFYHRVADLELRTSAETTPEGLAERVVRELPPG